MFFNPVRLLFIFKTQIKKSVIKSESWIETYRPRKVKALLK